MIKQRLRCCSTPPLTPIDDEKVRRIILSTPIYRIAQLIHKSPPTDGGLHPDRTTCQVSDVCDLIQQLLDIADVMMSVWADGILIGWHPADCSNLIGHLDTGQYTSLTRLRSL